jgi:hypothetical protein
VEFVVYELYFRFEFQVIPAVLYTDQSHFLKCTVDWTGHYFAVTTLPTWGAISTLYRQDFNLIRGFKNSLNGLQSMVSTAFVSNIVWTVYTQQFLGDMNNIDHIRATCFGRDSAIIRPR